MQAAEPVSAARGDSRASFDAAPLASLKVSTYFRVYDRIFAPYVGRPVTFVEVGVMHGGSLHMWRNFFGPDARIIGIDANPIAKRLESDGFDIVIGDQADPHCWASFYRDVGPVDILLDDGGHTFEQQIVTAECAARYVSDGRLVVTEDLHTSYMRAFHGPSSTSFVSYTKAMTDRIHARNGVASRFATPEPAVFALHTFESLVVLEIDRRACSQPSTVVWNEGARSDAATDVRHQARSRVRAPTGRPGMRRFASHLDASGPIFRFALRMARRALRAVRMAQSNARARRQFELRERMANDAHEPASTP